MDSTLIARYQSGGDIYASILAQHGQTAADACAAAALTGDETQINAALALYETAGGNATVAVPMATDTTASDFLNQIETDPLAAPLASAEKLASNSLLDFLKSPAVLLVIVLVLFFFVFDGLNILKGLVKKHTA